MSGFDIHEKNALSRLHAVRHEVCSTLIGRDSVVNTILKAIISKQHCLLYGPPGVAKSLVSESIFKRITGSRMFMTSMDKYSTNESVFGPVDIAAYRGSEGKSVLRHNTQGTLVDCHFAHLDELMDANPAVRRACLGILNERVFRKAAHNQKVPLWTAVGTTNFKRDTNEDEAVVDRFLFKVEVTRLADKERKRLLVWAANPPKVPVRATVSLDDIILLNDVVRRVEVDEEFIDAFEETIGVILKKGREVNVTDRRLVWALQAAKANAVMDMRTHLEVLQDLETAVTALFTEGSIKDSALYLTSLTTKLSDYQKSAIFRPKIQAVKDCIVSAKFIRGSIDDNDPDMEDCTKLAGIVSRLNKLAEELNNLVKTEVDTAAKYPASTQSRDEALELVETYSATLARFAPIIAERVLR